MLTFNQCLAEEYNRFKAKTWYHASHSDFDTFDVTKSDLGAHFGGKETANHILDNRLDGQPKHLYTIKLAIYNPLRLKDVGSFHADNINDQLLKKGIIDKKLFDKFAEKGSHKFRKENNEIVRSKLLANGYDGVVYTNTQEGGGSNYIAIRPEDIKIVKKEKIA